MDGAKCSGAAATRRIGPARACCRTTQTAADAPAPARRGANFGASEPLTYMDTFPRRDAMDERERRAAQLASVNGGAISRRQLSALGFSNATIRGRVRRHVLHDLGGDVFAWGHPLLPPYGWQHAALLSMGPDSAISWWAAGGILGMNDWDGRRLDVTIPRQQGRTPCRFVDVHLARDLKPDDVMPLRGLRLTTPARTLLDLATRVDQVELRRMAEVAVARHHVSPLHIEHRAQAASPAPGSARLRDLARSLRGTVEDRSRLERRFRSHWERAGHPVYQPSAMVEGLEVDGLWLLRRLILELDTYGTHGALSRYRNDRRRVRILGVAGFDVLHIAGEDFDADPDAVVADVARIVALHPPRELLLPPNLTVRRDAISPPQAVESRRREA